MEILEMPLKGAYLIKANSFEDERGEFFRTFCKNIFSENGLENEFVQTSISKNKYKGTLRGMHFQPAPFQEVKLVQCIRGKIYDVILDIRKDSNSFGQYCAVELSEYKNEILYVPKGFAHGFITLEDNSDILYQMSEFYIKDAESGIRYDDPYFNIHWPEQVKYISERDSNHNFWSKEHGRI